MANQTSFAYSSEDDCKNIANEEFLLRIEKKIVMESRKLNLKLMRIEEKLGKIEETIEKEFKTFKDEFIGSQNSK